jgi:hypothetical protein
MPALPRTLAANLTRESAHAIRSARDEQREAIQQVADRASRAADERRDRLESIDDSALRRSAQR